MKINEKEGYKGLTLVWRQKPCKRIGGKQQKIDWKPWPIEEREKSFWKSLKVTDHVKTQGFKKLSIQFLIDRKLDLIDRKSLSIDPTAIK